MDVHQYVSTDEERADGHADDDTQDFWKASSDAAAKDRPDVSATPVEIPMITERTSTRLSFAKRARRFFSNMV